MPAMNQKNLMISGAAADLGVGQSTDIAAQMQAKMDEIRKKQRGQKQDAMQSPAAMALLNPTFAGGGMNGG